MDQEARTITVNFQIVIGDFEVHKVPSVMVIGRCHWKEQMHPHGCLLSLVSPREWANKSIPSPNGPMLENLLSWNECIYLSLLLKLKNYSFSNLLAILLKISGIDALSYYSLPPPKYQWLSPTILAPLVPSYSPIPIFFLFVNKHLKPRACNCLIRSVPLREKSWIIGII